MSGAAIEIATKAPLIGERRRAPRSATAPFVALGYCKNALLRPAGRNGTGLSGHPEVAGGMSPSFSLVGFQTGPMATGHCKPISRLKGRFDFLNDARRLGRLDGQSRKMFREKNLIRNDRTAERQETIL
jgi:hypothetical protein